MGHSNRNSFNSNNFFGSEKWEVYCCRLNTGIRKYVSSNDLPEKNNRPVNIPGACMHFSISTGNGYFRTEKIRYLKDRTKE